MSSVNLVVSQPSNSLSFVFMSGHDYILSFLSSFLLSQSGSIGINLLLFQLTHGGGGLSQMVVSSVHLPEFMLSLVLCFAEFLLRRRHTGPIFSCKLAQHTTFLAKKGAVASH